MRIPINKLLFKKNIPAGMNYMVIGSLALMYRSTSQDAEPITVRRKGKYWLILDGRHRTVASIVAGRSDVFAVEEHNPEDHT